LDKDTFERTLRSYYKTTHPNFINPQIKLDWVNTAGWESEIYAYTLSHGLAEERKTMKLVLRLLTGGDLDSAELEFQMLKLLNKADYAVPHVYALGHPEDGFENPFIIMQCVEGGNFSSRFPRSREDDQEALIEFIRLFRRIHTLEWRSFKENADQLAPHDQPFFHFDRKMAFYKKVLNESGLSEFEPVMTWIYERREKAYCSESSVIHHDFHPGNILEDQNGKVFVVDWTSAEISDFRNDLAWTLTLALAYGGEVQRQMILDEYEHQLGHPVPELALFEVIAIMRRIGTVMISLSAGAESLGMRPETADIMRKDREPLMRIYDRLRNITGLSLSKIGEFISDLP
jgi:aminoglycoside phosphotransferase (APT) family kinase protein